LRSAHSGRRQKAQADGEDENPDKRYPEAGHARSNQSKEAREAVEDAPRPPCGQSAGDDADGEREKHREERQRQRGGKSFEDDGKRWPFQPDRLAEVQADDATKEIPELDDYRLVEAVEHRKFLSHLRCRIDREIEHRRVARQARDKEDEDQQADQ
jgi:hypothetical protein